jgi:hypothetical protein
MSTVVGARLKTCALCGRPLGRNLVVCCRCGYHRRPMLRVDGTGRIAEDVPCQECGYNLRGLAEDDQCPECAAPISRSTRRDLLRFADPRWLQRLALGSRLVIFGSIGIFAADIGGLVATWLLTNRSMEVLETLHEVAGLVRAGLLLVVAAGGWLLTTPEPGGAGPERRVGARKVARWCLAIVMAGTVFVRIGPDALVALARYPRSLAALVGAATVLVCLRALVLRIPHESLARQTRIVTWGYVTCHAVQFALAVTFTLFIWPSVRAGVPFSPSPAMQVYPWVSSVVGAAALAFGVLGLIVLIRSAVAFGRAAAAARAAWDGGEERVESKK